MSEATEESGGTMDDAAPQEDQPAQEESTEAAPTEEAPAE